MRNLVFAFLVLLSSGIQAAPGVFPESVFLNLDYGLYWFGYGDSWEKAIPGHSNAYYDINKPTVIFVHGQQNKGTVRKLRETFNRKDGGGPDADLAYYWLADGYNVGILYWNQFADEQEVKDAEAKVWTATGPQKMRWRSSKRGEYSEGPNVSAGELLYQSFRDNLVGFRGKEIRLLGHSLGNQMVIVLSKKISDAVSAGSISKKLLPRRVVLLDPFYSRGAKSYLGGKWVGEVSRTYVSELKSKGVVFEAYRSSSLSCITAGIINVGDCNNELMDMTAFTWIKGSERLGVLNFKELHELAVWYYLWSYGVNPPLISGTVNDSISSRSSISQVRAMMNSSEMMYQSKGLDTYDPSDDEFILTPR